MTPTKEGFDAGGHRGSQDTLCSQIRAAYGTELKMAAEWVEQLMGFNRGWTRLEGRSGE